MIAKIKTSKKDSEMINPSFIAPVISEYVACSQYESLVVKKPWGFEYLLFYNDFVAGWILHIQKGNRTSLHCHPNKKTSLVVLEGTGILRTSGGNHELSEGDCFMIDKGAFHSTIANSDLIVLEIESPPKKNDLYRFDDAYGRAFCAYEGQESQSSLNGYTQIPTLYNYRQNLGSTIDIGRYSLLIHGHKMIEGKYDLKNAIIGIISEGVLGGNDRIEPGDIVPGQNFENISAVDSNVINEILLIIKK